MSEVQDIGLDEIYTELVAIEGSRGTVFFCGSLPEDAEVVAEIADLLDGPVRDDLTRSEP